MKVRGCCEAAATVRRSGNGGEPRSRWLAGRFLESAGFAGPGVVLALLPKCPVCLAAWVAVGTGMSIPAAMAGRVRTLVMLVCISSMIYVAAKLIRRRFR